MSRRWDVVFPYLAAKVANHKILKKNLPDYNDLEKKWMDDLRGSKLDGPILEKISSDIYQSSNQRITNIENKSMSLVVTLGVSISLLSILVGVFEYDMSYVRLFALFILIFAIFHLLVAMMLALHAHRIGKIWVVSLEELSYMLSSQDKVIRWASQYLAATEINTNIGLMKSNWTIAAQNHTRLGLFAIIISMIIIIADLFYTNLGNISTS